MPAGFAKSFEGCRRSFRSAREPRYKARDLCRRQPRLRLRAKVAKTSSKPTPHFRPAWIAASLKSSRSKARLRRSVPLSPYPPLEFPADSNGLFHGLGDHAENSFSVDGQPITDQQSKVFSNQIPSESIQSMEVISGAPPAEYGDKTSVVIKVTTRSGQGVARPTGSITAGYGSFGSPSAGFDLAIGGPEWGNFIAASAMNSGRFLDGPEFSCVS